MKPIITSQTPRFEPMFTAGTIAERSSNGA